MGTNLGTLARAGVIGALGLLGSAELAMPSPAQACGGFFCGRKPVDQQAERVIFAVDREANQTEMIVEIQYQGDAPDFAWVVPLGEVPVEGSLDTFPQAAINALDANSAPQIWGGGCFFLDAAAGPPSANMRADDGEVMVFVREEVGPYDVAVIGSENSNALIEWLRENDFRITTSMEPYIAEYTAHEMKFLALRLRQDEPVEAIQPFRMRLPGSSPIIPLQMTAIAAEPEMGIVAFVLGEQRYEGANWPNLEVPNDYLVYDWSTGRHNWTAAVARVVDEAGGQGWVTETATSTESYIRRLENTTPADEEQEEAVNALLDLMRPHPYLSRMYTRLSPEEMTGDPIFRRSAGGDVQQWREISSADMDCSGPVDASMPEASPCDFMACGAGGRCAVTEIDGVEVAGCACVPGATARTTFSPEGEPTVSCIDMRMSFLNPGDVDVPGGTPLGDPCVGFDCGAGSCVAMNMTPTCVCEQGMVAVGDITDAGRTTRCVQPIDVVPVGFYDIRLPARPIELPAGRPVEVPPPTPRVAGGGLCAVDGPGTEHGIPGALAFGLVIGLGLRRRRAA